MEKKEKEEKEKEEKEKEEKEKAEKKKEEREKAEKEKSSSFLIPRGNPFSSKQSPPTMPIAPPHIQAMITCNLIRPGHTLPTIPAVVRNIYSKLWTHGGEFEAPPEKITRVTCENTAGIFVLNTVCSPFPTTSLYPSFHSFHSCVKRERKRKKERMKEEKERQWQGINMGS